LSWLITGLTAVLALAVQYVIIGVPLVPWALLITAVVAALAYLGTRLLPPVDPSWQALPAGGSAPIATHASSLGARLADAESDPHRYVNRVRPRLRALALGRIRRHPGCEDVDLADPRARELLGTDLHRLLTDPAATLPNPVRFAELLTRLEEL
jgi:hypothetical protein